VSGRHRCVAGPATRRRFDGLRCETSKGTLEIPVGASSPGTGRRYAGGRRGRERRAAGLIDVGRDVLRCSRHSTAALLSFVRPWRFVVHSSFSFWRARWRRTLAAPSRLPSWLPTSSREEAVHIPQHHHCPVPRRELQQAESSRSASCRRCQARRPGRPKRDRASPALLVLQRDLVRRRARFRRLVIATLEVTLYSHARTSPPPRERTLMERKSRI